MVLGVNLLFNTLRPKNQEGSFLLDDPIPWEMTNLMTRLTHFNMIYLLNGSYESNIFKSLRLSLILRKYENQKKKF